ncbi:MAG TPA: type IV toxin-antitoxin system AbiEi family antitoxin domain-containing protein [Streptosporangiaceae bacterium]|nr:type IV toxin-antitoxin system AbiEi family antitoxin domain-containing protein [Streptosporangiaceae bacterium]
MPIDRQDLRRRLMALAATQSGYFTAAEARKIGYSYPNQKFHVDRGNWVRVDRGIFRLPEWPVGPHDDLVRWSLWALGKGVVSHQTALTVHGIGEFDPARVHLTVPPRFSKSDPAVVLHRATLDEADTEDRSGFRVTTPLRSLIDVATIGADLDQLARAITEAREAGVVTPRRLRERAEEIDMRGALRVEQALGMLGA